jgi:hypothetical protein
MGLSLLSREVFSGRIVAFFCAVERDVDVLWKSVNEAVYL